MRDNNAIDFSWSIVGGSFVTLGVAYAVWYSFSVFFPAILKEFGWSRSVLAGTFSLFVILHSIAGPVVGSVVDRIGPRRVILLGSLILGVGLLACSFIRTWWHFYLAFGVMTAVGVGSTGWVPNTTLIQAGFKERRGLAMGIVSSGVGVGILVCGPLFQMLITGIGWRATYRMMALCVPFLLSSMAILFLKERPPRRNPAISPPFTEPLLRAAGRKATDPLTIRRAVTTKSFWLLGAGFSFASFGTQSVMAHQVVFFIDNGSEALFASFIAGIVGLVSVGGKILWCGISDKIGREITYTMGTGCTICGLVVLILFDSFHLLGLPYFYAVFFGLGYAVTAALPSLITADFFEGETYGGIFGSLMMCSGMGGALGSWFGGFLYDRFGSYVILFIIAIIFALVACLNVWGAAPRKIRLVQGEKEKSRLIVIQGARGEE